MEGVVEHSLSTDGQVLSPGKRILVLAVAHPGLAASGIKVSVGLIQINASVSQFGIKSALQFVLPEDRVGLAFVMRVFGG